MNLTKKKHRLALAGTAALLVLTGCKVGPDFKPEPPPVLAEFGASPLPPQTEGDAQRFLKGQAVAAAWWTSFGSPELTRRVERALSHSPTVASAQAALRRAREEVVAAGGARVPAVDLQAGGLRQQLGPDQGSPSLYTLTSASLTVTYTLDLFGGVRRGIEGLEAQADLRRWQLTGTYLSLASNVVEASIQEAALRDQLKAAGEIASLLEEQRDLTRKQVAIGVKGQADLLAVESQLAAARTALPTLGRQLQAARNQLAVLLGGFPSEEGLETLNLAGLSLPRDLPVSLPSQVVERRPDLQAAQAALHAATAAVGVATASLLPQVTLGGSYGSQVYRSGGLSGSGPAWDLTLGALQPLMHGGALRALKRGAEAGLDQAVADYRQTVLVAFANVADALDAVRFDAQAMQAQAEAEGAAARSLDLVKAQFRIGTASHLQLLDATRGWTQARMGLIQARAARLSDTTALYAALGGGL